MSDGLFWAAKLVNGQLQFYRSAVPTSGAALYWDKPDIYKYLILDDSGIHEMTQEQKDAVDAADAAAREQALAEQAAREAAEQAAGDEYRAEQERQYLLAVEHVTPLAAQYRDLLRKHFGVGAELNHEVTQESVLGYFALLTATGAITAQQTAEAALIQTLFVALSPLATDSAYSAANTWSEDFWALIP
jgi:hypothetical protein